MKLAGEDDFGRFTGLCGYDLVGVFEVPCGCDGVSSLRIGGYIVDIDGILWDNGGEFEVLGYYFGRRGDMGGYTVY